MPKKMKNVDIARRLILFVNKDRRALEASVSRIIRGLQPLSEEIEAYFLEILECKDREELIEIYPDIRFNRQLPDQKTKEVTFEIAITKSKGICSLIDVQTIVLLTQRFSEFGIEMNVIFPSSQ